MTKRRKAFILPIQLNVFGQNLVWAIKLLSIQGSTSNSVFLIVLV